MENVLLLCNLDIAVHYIAQAALGKLRIQVMRMVLCKLTIIQTVPMAVRHPCWVLRR